MLLLLTLIIVFCALLLRYLRYHYEYWTRRGVPQETPVLFLGNMKGLGKTLQFRDIYQRIYNKFKGTAPFVGIYFLFTKAALIFDLELIKSILIKDFANFHDRGVFHNVRDDPLTGHLVNIEGQEWRALRTKLTPIFTSGKMKYMFPTIVGVSEHLVDTVATMHAANKNDDALEMKELCARYTTDVIGTCAFGLECNSLKDPNAEFRRKGRSIFEKPRHSQLMQVFIFLSPNLAKFLRMKYFADDVTEFFLNAVSTTVEYRLKNNIKRNDFMDLLIEMMAKDEVAASKNDGIDLSHGLTLKQIAAQAFVFFVAGFDTSSTTMAFCLYELALNQDIQQRLYEEIEDVLEKYEGVLTYEAMNEMSYLEQVVDETLRKYPVLPNVVRKTIADYKVAGTNYVIEAGTSVVIPIDAILHDEEYFPEPEKFDPSRFEAENIAKRHPMTYLPFGDGPRICIGMRFGKMQAKIGLINLLRNFKFTKSPQTEEPLEFCKTNFLLTAKNGIYLYAEKRNI